MNPLRPTPCPTLFRFVRPSGDEQAGRMVVGILTTLLLALAAPAVEPVKYMPESTRFVAVWEVDKTPAVSWAIGDKSPFATAITELSTWAARLGLDPVKQMQAVWLGMTEAYPRGTLLVLRGNFDVSGIERKLSDLSKNPRVVTAYSRDRDVIFASVQVPPVTAPLPGFPGTLHVAVLSAETILVGFDRETVTEAATRKIDRRSAPVDSQLKHWDASAPLRAVAVWPPSSNLSDAALAGCQYTTLAVTFAAPPMLRCNFAFAEESAAGLFADKANTLAAEVRQLFPLLSNQQGVDPTLARCITAAANTAKVERTGANVAVIAELPAGVSK